jgi:dihydroorotate dehydrogenase electron transfer subunit
MKSQSFCRIDGVQEVRRNIFVLRFLAPAIAQEIRPGQFLNIRTTPATEPLLRRPFSVYRVDGDMVEILFQVVGKGTSHLAGRRPGDPLDVLGPLGVAFGLNRQDYSTAVLVGGGLGVAPLPAATAVLLSLGKSVLTVLGARTAEQVVHEHLENVQISTDDGSRGMQGTVVQLLVHRLETEHPVRPKIFACGPNPMLRALAEVARFRAIPCEVSLEGPMACGFGICQGCPVELSGAERAYALMCTDGPVFDINRIRIPA